MHQQQATAHWSAQLCTMVRADDIEARSESSRTMPVTRKKEQHTNKRLGYLTLLTLFKQAIKLGHPLITYNLMFWWALFWFLSNWKQTSSH